jgi:hypothetical protein
MSLSPNWKHRTNLSYLLHNLLILLAKYFLNIHFFEVMLTKHNPTFPQRTQTQIKSF